MKHIQNCRKLKHVLSYPPVDQGKYTFSRSYSLGNHGLFTSILACWRVNEWSTIITDFWKPKFALMGAHRSVMIVANLPYTAGKHRTLGGLCGEISIS